MSGCGGSCGGGDAGCKEPTLRPGDINLCGVAAAYAPGRFKRVARHRLADFRPGDRVVCVSNIGVEMYLDVGREYEIQAVNESGETFTLLSGGSFGRNRFARLLTMAPRYTINWEKHCKEARAELADVTQALNDPKLDGPWGRTGRINKLKKLLAEAEDKRDRVKADHDAFIAYAQKVTKAVDVERKPGEHTDATIDRVFAEHARMKRQLEVAETYNFDRKGLTDDEAKLDLYNFVLKGLGKKPLTKMEWLVERVAATVGKAMAKGFAVSKHPTFDSVFSRYGVNVTIPQTLQYIPIDFIITDPKPSHQGDAYSPTGCGQDCSHPDCKDRK